MSAVVDVIIPVFRPGNDFKEIIERIRKQTIVPDNIIIVNTIPRPSRRSEDKGSVISFLGRPQQEAPDYIVCANGEKLYLDKKSKKPKITVYNITQDEFDHGATRDFGIAMSDADYIVLMSQDTMPLDRHLIEHLVLPFSDKSVACSYGRQFCEKNAGVLDRYAKTVDFPARDRVKSGADLKTLGTKTYFCSNACAAYRRSVYNELGGFGFRTIFNEDMIFGAKIITKGYKIAYASKARVRHYRSFNLKQTLQRSFDMGVLNRQNKELFKIIKGKNESSIVLKDGIKYLIRTNNISLIPKLLLYNIVEDFGYDAGYNYEKIPAILIKRLTLNKEYWRRN